MFQKVDQFEEMDIGLLHYEFSKLRRRGSPLETHESASSEQAVSKKSASKEQGSQTSTARQRTGGAGLIQPCYGDLLPAWNCIETAA